MLSLLAQAVLKLELPVTVGRPRPTCCVLDAYCNASVEYTTIRPEGFATKGVVAYGS